MTYRVYVVNFSSNQYFVSNLMLSQMRNQIYNKEIHMNQLPLKTYIHVHLILPI